MFVFSSVCIYMISITCWLGMSFSLFSSGRWGYHGIYKISEQFQQVIWKTFKIILLAIDLTSTIYFKKLTVITISNLWMIWPPRSHVSTASVKVSPRKSVVQFACQYDVTSRVSDFQNGEQTVHPRDGCKWCSEFLDLKILRSLLS